MRKLLALPVVAVALAAACGVEDNRAQDDLVEFETVDDSVPQACIEALDLADELILTIGDGLLVGADMSAIVGELGIISADAVDAAFIQDVVGIEDATAQLEDLTVRIEDNSDILDELTSITEVVRAEYDIAAAECRNTG